MRHPGPGADVISVLFNLTKLRAAAHLELGPVNAIEAARRVRTALQCPNNSLSHPSPIKAGIDSRSIDVRNGSSASHRAATNHIS